MKRKHLLLSLIPLVACTLYTGVWFSMKSHIEAQIEQMKENAAKQGITIIADKPRISGFPGSYNISTSGTIEHQGISLAIQDMVIQSFFLPQTELSIHLPHGVVVYGTGNPELDSLDRLAITIKIPEDIPPEFTRQTMQQWQTNNGSLEIINYEVWKEDLKVKGAGKITLDKELQPEGMISTHITGLLPFLEWLKDQKVIEGKDALIAKAVLSTLNKNDPDTGESTLNTKLTLQNRRLFLGPLRLLKLPRIDWESADHPALPR